MTAPTALSTWCCHGYSWVSSDGRWLVSPERTVWVLSARGARNWHPVLFFESPEAAAEYVEEQA